MLFLSTGLWSFLPQAMTGAKSAIIFVLFVVSLLILIKGYNFYQYIKEDPAFCNTCHLMNEAYKDWRLSGHSGIICQSCHKLGLVEANRMLLAFALKGQKSPRQSHGRKNAWEDCIGCHTSEVAQGAKTLRASYGHARHVYMQSIQCKTCHKKSMHSFPVSNEVCQSCHKDKVVHGMGTSGLYCLNCHSFGEESPKMVTSERCFQCHKDMPRKGPMASLRCYDCHRPHERLKLTSQDCLGRCHSNEAKVGKHGLHLKKATSDCLFCHRPHVWMVGEKRGRKLCSRCHEYRNPVEFIY